MTPYETSPTTSSSTASPSSTESSDSQDLRELTRLLEETSRRRERKKLELYSPVPKQRAFHDAGAIHRERLLLAGNQCGKTTCGAAETAYHLTGRYPPDWAGKRF